jgi:Tfp pilus assembly protein PilF
MKSNWGPEGLHQAEKLLASALQIRPDSVNAKILLGYVYAHQGRHKQSEALFVDASQTDTKNLWLWSNWGEVLVMQGKLEPAIQKYREAVKRPREHDTYDRARLDAYAHLLPLLEQRKDLDGMEALLKQARTSTARAAAPALTTRSSCFSNAVTRLPRRAWQTRHSGPNARRHAMYSASRTTSSGPVPPAAPSATNR